MLGIVLHPGATTTSSVPVFAYCAVLDLDTIGEYLDPTLEFQARWYLVSRSVWRIARYHFEVLRTQSRLHAELEALCAPRAIDIYSEAQADWLGSRPHVAEPSTYWEMASGRPSDWSGAPTTYSVQSWMAPSS